MLGSFANVTFLLGSGTSIPSGYPSTAEITQSLFKKNWLQERDQKTYGTPLTSPFVDPEYWEQVEAKQRLIRLLRNHVDEHLALYGDAEANYEDIYFLGRQLLDSLSGEYENPGLLPWLIDLRSKLATLEGIPDRFFNLRKKPKWHEKGRLTTLVERSLAHIQESVAAQLVLRKRKKGLKLLRECLSVNRPSPLHIASLNHDTLLDSLFLKETVLDGFRPFSGEAELFDPMQFETGTPFHVQLLKLHGSIDWFHYKGRNGADLAIRVKTGDADHIKDDLGNDLRVWERRLLLAGTTNKELDYGSGIFLELMFQFYRRLKQTDLLIVSGYGFGDKGINNRIWAWLDARAENRIMVLHENIDALRRTAKRSFSLNMDRHKETKKFAIVDRWMCNCSIDDLKREVRFWFGQS